MSEQDEDLTVMFDKIIRVATMRRWWLLVPTAVVALGACATSMVLPKHYKSEATILVEHQQVPERYVTPNSDSNISELLLLITDAILSRTQLVQIMNEFDLYPQDRKRLAPEELVELMRHDITIEPTGKGTEPKGTEPKDLAFKISYAGADPHVAQEVTSKLTMLFIQENLKSREEQSSSTTSFLEDQLQSAAADLRLQASRVRDFKMHYLGELPEQEQGNLTTLTGLHAQLQITQAALSHARQQEVFYESLLSRYVVSPTEINQAELTRLRNERADLLARYTDQYPDVAKIDAQIKEAEALLATSTKRSEAVKGEANKESAESLNAAERDPTTAQLKSQLEATRLEIRNAIAEQRQTEALIAKYQSRLNMTPVREEQLADILRDYDLSKKNYDDLVGKKTQSQLATSLERRQQGQQFRIIDSPSLPMKTSGADHVKIALGGLAVGLALGVGLVLYLETKDHTLANENDLSRYFPFPLMVSLPAMPTTTEERGRSRRVQVEWLVGVTLGLLICATEYFVYRRG